ncbi:MAG: hypothetical protein ACI9WU_003933 [Myxococcota bacterium]
MIRAIAAVFLLTGCAATLDQREVFLASVPADTPYFTGSLEPFPPERWKRASGALEGMFETFDGIWAALPQDLANEDTSDMMLVRFVAAMGDELRGGFNREGVQALGINPDGPYILYGLGLQPVVRIALTDGQALRAAVERVVKKVGVELPIDKQHAGRAYWHIQVSEGVVVLVSIADGDLIATATFDSEPDLDSAFAITSPERSLADSGKLDQVFDGYGFDSAGAGFLEFQQLMQLVATAGTDNQFGSEAAEMFSGPCGKEVLDAVAHMPRVLMGYTAPTRGVLAIETSAIVRDGLARLQSPMPSLGGLWTERPILGMSVNVDVGAAVDLLVELGQYYSASACMPLATAAAALKDLPGQLLGPLAQIRGINGLQVVVENVAGIDVAPELRAWLSVSHDHPDQLGQALKMVGALAGFSWPDVPDGQSAALEVSGQIPLVQSLQVIRQGTILAVSSGSDMQVRVAQALKAAPAQSRPLFEIGFDERRYTELALKFMPALVDDSGVAEVQEIKLQSAKSFLYGAVELTDRGISIWAVE